MQGRKTFQTKMLTQVNLDDLVPKNNFYRILLQTLDLQFLYAATARYYGSEGNPSIDPVVFFKICLVGYLNNITSDRRLLDYCSNCLDIRFYLGYDLDESLPWHSTISRTRQLYGEEVFLELFKKILSLCIKKGMVRGRRKAIDSAYIKANASMDSLVEKEISESIVNGQIYSLILALIAIIILLSLIFKSINAGIIGSLPLVFAVFCTFGLMGWLGIELNMVTALLSSISIGLGVDFTIHIFWRIKWELSRGNNYAGSIISTLKTIGRGISINALSVMLGFSVLFFSLFPLIQSFAFLIIISLFLCLMSALILIPALCIRFKPKFLEK